MTQTFVGFGKATDFLAAIDRSQPVNAECVTLTGKAGKFGIALATTVIVLSQPRGSEIFYFYSPISRYQTLNGEPMIMNKQEIENRQTRNDRAYEITLAWLAGAGVTARHSIIAMPSTYRMLEGYADYMRYDKGSDLWIAVSAEA